jgi:sugar O-acyltransferase (sialic acid O-acetyltransferase NeuD family)
LTAKRHSIVIYGAGGHGREILDLFAARDERNQIVGFVDDSAALQGKTIDGLQVLGPLSWLVDHAPEFMVVVAIGENGVRRRLAARVAAAGVQFATAISPFAHVSPRAVVEPGAMVCAGAIVNTGARLGLHSIVNVASTVSHDVSLGPFAHLACGVHLAGNVNIGEGCEIGTGAVVNPRVRIGAWTVVGSGAAVVSDLPVSCVAMGVPAQIVSRS